MENKNVKKSGNENTESGTKQDEPKSRIIIDGRSYELIQDSEQKNSNKSSEETSDQESSQEIIQNRPEENIVVCNGHRTSVGFSQACRTYSPKQTMPQPAEFWRYTDKRFATFGRL